MPDFNLPEIQPVDFGSSQMATPENNFSLNLDENSLWSKLGSLDPQGMFSNQTGSGNMNEQGGMNTQNPADNTDAPLDALYSMIGMKPMQADSMGRYNITPQQQQSANNQGLSGILGSAAKVMFGTGSVNDLIDTSFGETRDKALQGYSNANAKDYSNKVEMALKGSELQKQKVLVETEQEKLRTIFERREFGSQWSEMMEPVFAKYAAEVSSKDEDAGKQFAAGLVMVKAKAATGDMENATILLDSLQRSMPLTETMKQDFQDDLVKQQYKTYALMNGFDETRKTFLENHPGWGYEPKQNADGSITADILSPFDLQNRQMGLDVKKAQIANYGENSAAMRYQMQGQKQFNTEVEKMNKVAPLALKDLTSSIEVLKGKPNPKGTDAKLRSDAQGKIAFWSNLLVQSGMVNAGSQEEIMKQIEPMLAHPDIFTKTIQQAYVKTNPILSQAFNGQASQAQPGASQPQMQGQTGFNQNSYTPEQLVGIFSRKLAAYGSGKEIPMDVYLQFSHASSDPAWQKWLDSAMAAQKSGKPLPRLPSYTGQSSPSSSIQ